MRKCLIALLLLIHPLLAVSDFCVLTVPKCGTFLMMKLMPMLSGKQALGSDILTNTLGAYQFLGDGPTANLDVATFTQEIETILNKNCFPILHTNFCPLFDQFTITHPNCVKILQIRDLRDALVSSAFMSHDNIAAVIGTQDFDKQLMYLINMEPQDKPQNILNMRRYAEEAVRWYYRPDVVVARFEKLVGPQGGGKKSSQERQIIRIANAISVILTQDQLNNICNSIFGGTATFRDGQIGSWKKYFKKAHIKAFKKKFGHLQLALGYELD